MIPDAKRKSKLQIYSKNYIIDTCSEIVTINGHSLSLFEESAYQKLLLPIIEGIGEERDIVNKNSLIQEITDKTIKLVGQFRKEIKDKFLSIKIDKPHLSQNSNILISTLQSTVTDLFTIPETAFVISKLLHNSLFQYYFS